MDTTEKEQLAQEQMDQLKEALKKSRTVNNTGAVSGSLNTDTITLSGGVGQPYNNNSTIIGGGYTVGTGINWNTGTSITANPWATTTSTGRMELNGDNADLVINGVSVLDILKDRLNVLIPNPTLEKEWDELKALGDQYRALEQDIKEKAEIWARLNKPS